MLKAGLALASVVIALLGMASVSFRDSELPPVHRAPSLDDAPATLDECLVMLADRLPEDVVEAMRNGTEADMIHYHHGLGTWIRNTWGLWSRGPLYSHFRDRGLEHPDDMSAVILTSFWRRLHGQPLRFEEQVQSHQAYWRRAKTRE